MCDLIELSKGKRKEANKNNNTKIIKMIDTLKFLLHFNIHIPIILYFKRINPEKKSIKFSKHL